MLIKRTHLFLEILLGIFIAYLLLMRLAVIGMQSYPQQTLQLVNKVTGWHFSVGSVELDQTWLGAEFVFHSLQVKNDTLDIQAQELSGDINIFSPMLPILSFGEQLNLKQVSLRLLRPPSREKQVQELPELSQLTTAYRQVVNFLRMQDFTQRSWQKIRIDGLVVNDFLGAQTALQVDNLDLIKASQINLIAEFGVHYRDVLDFERFNLKINLTTNSWGGLDYGSINLISYQPMQMQRIAKLLPEKWAEVLPEGEVLLDWQTRFEDAQLAHSIAKLNAQALLWGDDDEVLPSSVGLTLRWNPRLDASLGDALANFELAQVQLDNQFVETLSPVQLRLHDGNELELLADRFDIEPFKDMLRVFVESDYLASLLNKAVELEVTDFALRLNWQTLEVPNLRTRFGRLGIPLTDYPGVATQDVVLAKQGDLLLIDASEPIWVLEPKVHPLPVRVTLPQTVVLNYVDQNVMVDPVDFSVDQLAVSLESFDWVSDHLALKAKITAPDVNTLLGYLPYEMLGKDVNDWLGSSNLSGQKTNIALVYQGPITGVTESSKGQDADWSWLDALSVSGLVKQASFKFDSEWPQIDPSDIGFEYKNCQLSFTSDVLRLQGVSSPAKVKAKFSDLSKDDIALQVKASLDVLLPEAISYLAKTPLPAKVGLNEYVRNHRAFSGSAQIDIPELWIPIDGFAGKDEKIQGSVRLNNVSLALQGFPEVSDLKGRLQFTEQTLATKGLAMQLLAQPATLDVSTDLDRQQMRFILRGKEREFTKDYFVQAVPFDVTFVVPTGNQSALTHFSGKAHLQKASSSIPAPFSVKDLLEPLSFSGTIDKKVTLRLKQPGIVQADVIYSLAMASIEQIQADIGLEKEVRGSFSGQKSYIRGSIDKLSAADWIQWWNALPTSNKSSPLKHIVWQDSQLTIGELSYKGQLVEAITLSLDRLEKSYKVSVDSKKLSGNVFLSDKGPINVQLDRVRLTSQKTGEMHEQLLCAVQKEQTQYPEINVLARNVQFDSYPFDQVRFTLKPNEYGYFTDDVYAQFSQGAGLVTAKYRYDQNRNLSAAEIDVSSTKLERLMKYLGISKGVTSKKADIHSEIAWFGGFECFSLNGLFGRLNFKLDEGVVEDVEPGVARLLGLLSVDSLARRLQLKLDDVTNKGLIYDDIEGKAILNNNKLQLVNLDLDAPAVKVAMKGLIDVQRESFDLRANVTPSIGSSLPTIAALAGVANPLAALAVYTVMKVLPDINENLVTYQYKINGPWKEPDIKLVPQLIE